MKTYKKYMLRPIIYMTATRLMLALIFLLGLSRLVSRGPAPAMIAALLPPPSNQSSALKPRFSPIPGRLNIPFHFAKFPPSSGKISSPKAAKSSSLTPTFAAIWQSRPAMALGAGSICRSRIFIALHFLEKECFNNGFI